MITRRPSVYISHFFIHSSLALFMFMSSLIMYCRAFGLEVTFPYVGSMYNDLIYRLSGSHGYYNRANSHQAISRFSRVKAYYRKINHLLYLDIALKNIG